MTFAQIQKASSATTRKLILEMHGGVLSDAHQRALDGCLGPTSDLWIGLIDGRPVCAWGLVPPTMLSDRAYLWLYATPAIDAYKFRFIRTSMLVMEELREMYPVIHGICDVNNSRAIRWLKRLGAEFSGPVDGHIPFVIGGH